MSKIVDSDALTAAVQELYDSIGDMGGDTPSLVKGLISASNVPHAVVSFHGISEETVQFQTATCPSDAVFDILYHENTKRFIARVAQSGGGMLQAPPKYYTSFPGDEDYNCYGDGQDGIRPDVIFLLEDPASFNHETDEFMPGTIYAAQDLHGVRALLPFSDVFDRNKVEEPLRVVQGDIARINAGVTQINTDLLQINKEVAKRATAAELLQATSSLTEQIQTRPTTTDVNTAIAQATLPLIEQIQTRPTMTQVEEKIAGAVEELPTKGELDEIFSQSAGGISFCPNVFAFIKYSETSVSRLPASYFYNKGAELDLDSGELLCFAVFTGTRWVFIHHYTETDTSRTFDSSAPTYENVYEAQKIWEPTSEILSSISSSPAKTYCDSITIPVGLRDYIPYTGKFRLPTVAELLVFGEYFDVLDDLRKRITGQSFIPDRDSKNLCPVSCMQKTSKDTYYWDMYTRSFGATIRSIRLDIIPMFSFSAT